MARANRHYIPGCVWHITHRCHKQEFLLKFEKDRFYSIVDQQALHRLFDVQRDKNTFRQMDQEWVGLELKNDESKRQSFWSE